MRFENLEKATAFLIQGGYTDQGEGHWRRASFDIYVTVARSGKVQLRFG